MAANSRAIPTLPDGAHRLAGRFDNAGRWCPGDEYVIAGTFQVRGPSRAYPFSYLAHFYTRVYSRALLLARPDLWLALNGYSNQSSDAFRWLAARAAILGQQEVAA